MKLSDPKDLGLKEAMTVRIYTDENGVFYARVDEKPGLMTDGDSLLELLINLDDAVDLWDESMKESK